MVDKKKEQVSKEIILQAAREVFIEKGFDGARMQEIANKAGINKALLHYYYSSKENLFEEVFKEAFEQFAPQFREEIKRFTSFRSFLKVFLDLYLKMLIDKPYLPLFVLSEIQRNPDRPARFIREMGIDPEWILNMIQSEMDTNKIIKADPREIVMNILSLCIFPFAARPMIQRLLWKNNEAEYQKVLQNRADSIYKFIEKSVFTENN